MVGQTLLAVLGVTLAASTLAAEQTVRTSFLNAFQTCTHTPTLCKPGLSCDGKRAQKRCITYKPAGMPCPADEDFWICTPGLTCESNVCKIPRGKDCTANPTQCAAGLSCDGKRASKRCITYKPAGMPCPSNEDFWICAPGLTCQSDVCKIPVGASCAASPSSCVAGAECRGAGGSKTCAPTPAKLGETCSATVKCASGLACDAGVCKIPRGQDCTANPTQCAAGLSCDGKRAAKRCITYKPAGMRCPANEDFWICAPGLTCQADVCKIPLGSNCSASPTSCIAGAECRGAGGSKTCAPTPAKLGETCNVSTKCATGLTCDSGVCKLPRGTVCTATPSLCASGLSCDGKRAVKRCITYKPAGMGCPANEDFWICAPGLTCESDVCKVPLGGSCAASPEACAAGTRCKGGRRNRTCRRQRSDLGEACGLEARCKRGLKCDGVCKLRRNARSDHTPTLCADGLACVGVRREKVCLRLRTEGRRCGTIGFLQCAPGLSCVRNRCVRGTETRGDRCGRGLFCSGGLVCGGKGRRRKCVEPMGLGQKCGVDPYWVCAPNARCLRNRCREW